MSTKPYLCQKCGETEPAKFYESKGHNRCKACVIADKKKAPKTTRFATTTSEFGQDIELPGPPTEAASVASATPSKLRPPSPPRRMVHPPPPLPPLPSPPAAVGLPPALSCPTRLRSSSPAPTPSEGGTNRTGGTIRLDAKEIKDLSVRIVEGLTLAEAKEAKATIEKLGQDVTRLQTERDLARQASREKDAEIQALRLEVKTREMDLIELQTAWEQAYHRGTQPLTATDQYVEDNNLEEHPDNHRYRLRGSTDKWTRLRPKPKTRR